MHVSLTAYLAYRIPGGLICMHLRRWLGIDGCVCGDAGKLVLRQVWQEAHAKFREQVKTREPMVL